MLSRSPEPDPLHVTVVLDGGCHIAMLTTLALIRPVPHWTSATIIADLETTPVTACFHARGRKTSWLTTRADEQSQP